MKGNAFVPGHITGFFEIFDDRNPIKAGSKGAGVVLDKGVYTNVKAQEGNTNKISVLLNGEPCDCPVTMAAVKGVLMLAGRRFDVEVFHELDIQMGQGFGASGAGAFGAALATSRALDLSLTLNQCGAIAHKAEVLNRTGLGDVLAQSVGGLVIRTRPGAPGTGATDGMFSDRRVLAFVVGDEVETKSVLLDKTKKEKINKIGGECLGKLLKYPTPENFMGLSRKFAVETGLMDKKLYSAVKTLEKNNIIASMSMLGNCVFTLTEEPEEASEYLDYLYIIADIDYTGARILA
jgi:pantoate kinase